MNALTLVLVAIAGVGEPDPAKKAAEFHERGFVDFKLGKFAESVRDFDREIELRPAAAANHWQRGISCYYAGQYDAGRRQFESCQQVEGDDVENTLWRFMCMARADGLAKARAAIYKFGNDRRVPMRQVYDLFKGDGSVDAVLAAARKQGEAGRGDAMFYAHLYLGIYYDLSGDTRKALDHLDQANAQSIAHPYMREVARIQRDVLRKK